MATHELKTHLSSEVTFTLTYAEARALEAIMGYGVEGFLQCFYKNMGKAYLEPYEKGIKSLFKIRDSLDGQLERLDNIRKVLALENQIKLD